MVGEEQAGAAATPLSPPSLARGGVQRDVREAANAAKHCMEDGDLDGGRMHLDKAHMWLERAREAWPEGWGDRLDDVLAAEGSHPAELSIGGLTVLVCNMEASWWWNKRDLPKAAQVLTPALNQHKQGRPSNRQLAFTYSNLCAILSKMGHHDIAIKKARAAVKHCMDALKEANEANDRAKRQQAAEKGTGSGGSGGADPVDASSEAAKREGVVQRTLLTLAIASHNLAVEVEFVHGKPCLKWYEQAAELARRASSSTIAPSVGTRHDSSSGEDLLSMSVGNNHHHRRRHHHHNNNNNHGHIEENPPKESQAPSPAASSDSDDEAGGKGEDDSDEDDDSKAVRSSAVLKSLEGSLHAAQAKWARKDAEAAAAKAKRRAAAAQSDGKASSRSKKKTNNGREKTKPRAVASDHADAGSETRMDEVEKPSVKMHYPAQSASRARKHTDARDESDRPSDSQHASQAKAEAEAGGVGDAGPTTLERNELRNFDFGDKFWRVDAPVGGPAAAERRRRERASKTTPAQRRREAAAEATEQGVPTPRTAAGIPFVPQDAWKSRPLKQAAELREQGVEFGPQFMFEREQKRQAKAEEKHGGAFRLRGQGAEEQLAEFRVRLEQLYGLPKELVEDNLDEFKARMADVWAAEEATKRRGRPAREPRRGNVMKARHSNTRVKAPKLVEPAYGNGAYGLVPIWAEYRPWEAAPAFAYKRFHPFLEAKELRAVRRKAGFRPKMNRLEKQLNAANKHKEELLLAARRKQQEDKPWRSGMLPPDTPDKYEEFFERFANRRTARPAGADDDGDDDEERRVAASEEANDKVPHPPMHAVRAQAARALARVRDKCSAVAAKMKKKLGAAFWFAFFNEIDVDGTGRIDRDEFKGFIRVSLKVPPKAVSDEDVASMFLTIDRDGRGFVEVGEFANFMDGKAFKPQGNSIASSSSSSNNQYFDGAVNDENDAYGDPSRRHNRPQPSMRRKLNSQPADFTGHPPMPPTVGRPKTTGAANNSSSGSGAGGGSNPTGGLFVSKRPLSSSNHQMRGAPPSSPPSSSSSSPRAARNEWCGPSAANDDEEVEEELEKDGNDFTLTSRKPPHSGASGHALEATRGSRRMMGDSALYTTPSDEDTVVHLERRQLLLAYENAKADALSALYTKNLIEEIEHRPGNYVPNVASGESSSPSAHAAPIASSPVATESVPPLPSALAQGATSGASSISRKLQAAQQAARSQQQEWRDHGEENNVNSYDDNVEGEEEAGTYYDDEYEAFEPSHQGSYIESHSFSADPVIDAEDGDQGNTTHLPGYDVEMEPPEIGTYDQTVGMRQQDPHVARPVNPINDDDDEDDARRVNGLDLVQNLQDQILSAIDQKDIQRAADLNAQLAELEQDLGRR